MLPPVTLHVAGDVYGEDDVQERPRLTAAPPITYPAPLLLARISGRVLVEAVIDTNNGRPRILAWREDGLECS